MELKKGYQHTEVGIIPKDWEVRKLDDLSKRGSGHTPSKKYSNYYNGGIVWVSLADSNLLDNGIISKSAVNISELGLRHSSAVLHPKGAVIISRDAGIGKSAIAGCNLCVSQHFIVWKCKETILHNWFLYYWLQYQKSEFERIAIGSTIKTIGLPYFEKYQIPLPSFSEQTAIAIALSDMDDLINSLSTLIEKKKAIKQGAMQQLLKPKEGWVVKKLGESADIFRGGSPRPIESFITANHNGINWIKIGDVGKNAKFIETTEEKIKPEGSTRSRFVNEGDFLLSNSMSFGRPYILKTEGCIHDGWLVIQNYQEHFDREFLYYVLGSQSVLFQYKAMASGSSVLNLNKEIVKNVYISCPKSIEEQTRIATSLSDMDNEITGLELKFFKCQNIKQGMMQELLTGKTRLV